MSALRLRGLLTLLVGVGAATAVPVAPASAEPEGTLPAADDAGFEPDTNLLQTGTALASQHNRLMAATDVFGLYRDELGVGAPGPFPDFAGFSGPVLPVRSPESGPVLRLYPRWGDDTLREVAMEEEARPTELVPTEDAGTEPPARETAFATARKTLIASKPPSAEPEQQSAEPEASPLEPEPPARPDVLPDRPQAQTVESQESQVVTEMPARPSREPPAPASHAQPLKLPNTPILCLLPEPGRRAPHAHPKDGHHSRTPAPGAPESGDRHHVEASIPSDASAPGQPRAKTSREPGTLSGTPDRHPPPLFRPQLGQTFNSPGQPTPGDDSTTFDQFWDPFGADLGAPGVDGPQITFEPFPDQSFAASDPSADPALLPDPSTFGQQPNKPPPADGTKQGPQEQLGSPTYFAPYPRRSSYSQTSVRYPTASRSPVTSNPWSQPTSSWGADPTWSYTSRSSTSVSRRTAYPAPWRGQGRGPAGAVGWPWPALATESRGRPRPVPTSSVYLVPRQGQWSSLGGYPLYSQWYRPAVVPLPGGGGGGAGWWTPDGRFVRPATAMATSEESGLDSPPLDADWAWPAVSMLGGRDALVVTGLGRSSGAMSRAGGEHGWPPVASATAGRRGDGAFSRASSGGFELIFEDGMFHTGPMAQRKSPEEHVPPQKRTKKPETDAEKEDGPKEGEEGETEEEVEGSGEIGE